MIGEAWIPPCCSTREYRETTGKKNNFVARILRMPSFSRPEVATAITACAHNSWRRHREKQVLSMPQKTHPGVQTLNRIWQHRHSSQVWTTYDMSRGGASSVLEHYKNLAVHRITRKAARYWRACCPDACRAPKRSKATYTKLSSKSREHSPYPIRGGYVEDQLQL